jgi:hypothetical protein
MNEIGDEERIMDKLLSDIAFLSYDFDKIPPIIGIITANKFGNTLMVCEYGNNARNGYGPIKSFLLEDDKKFLDIDLISMYFSSFKAFAGETNIQNLSNLEIIGSNLKVQLFFLLDKYMIITFLNSKVDLSIKEKAQIVQYFEDNLLKHEFEFTHFNASNSRKIIQMLEDRGTAWFKNLNKNYIKSREKRFLEKHEMIEMIMNTVTPIIQDELSENLEGIPEDIIINVSKEIRNKIQDKICEFNLYFE